MSQRCPKIMRIVFLDYLGPLMMNLNRLRSLELVWVDFDISSEILTTINQASMVLTLSLLVFKLKITYVI